MKEYNIFIDGREIKFKPSDVCTFEGYCPIKDSLEKTTGFIHGSFICYLCQNFKGLDIPNEWLQQNSKGS